MLSNLLLKCASDVYLVIKIQDDYLKKNMCSVVSDD